MKKATRSRTIRWPVVALIACGGLAVLVMDVMLGAPMAGWHRALAASGLAVGITAVGAYVFAHRHPQT